jgi:hypothetical protein
LQSFSPQEHLMISLHYLRLIKLIFKKQTIFNAFACCIFFMLMFNFSACLYDSPADLATPVTYCDTTYAYKNIKPIVFNNCTIAGCHVVGGIGHGVFTDFAQFKSKVDAGLVKYRINLPLSDPDHMPATGSLTDSEIQLINDWIDSGAEGCW